MKNPKPEPVVTATACSLCGLNWDDHGDKPTPQTCIDLLRAELAKPRGYAQGGMVRNSGTFIVGERGPEILRLPSPAIISPNTSTSGTIASTSYTTLHAVRPPDDPDMGVPAKVG